MVDGLFDFVGVKDLADNEPHFNKELRIMATNWACRMGSESCTEATNAELRENWSNIHSNMRPTIYCNALRTNNDSDFLTLKSILNSTFDSNERNILLTALGCSQNESQLYEYIQSSIENSYMSETENYQVFTAVIENGQLGVSVAIQFLENYLLEAARSYGETNINSALITIASNVVSSENEQRVNDVLKLYFVDFQFLTFHCLL